jgi:hypothetical protein
MTRSAGPEPDSPEGLYLEATWNLFKPGEEERKKDARGGK